MIARGNNAVITFEKGQFNKFERKTPSSCRGQKFCFKLTKVYYVKFETISKRNAGKTITSIKNIERERQRLSCSDA